MRTREEICDDIDDAECDAAAARDDLSWSEERLEKLYEELADLEIDEALEDE